MYSVVKMHRFPCIPQEDSKYVDIVFPADERALSQSGRTHKPTVPEVFVTASNSTSAFKSGDSIVIRISSDEPLEAIRLAKLSVGTCLFPMTQQLKALRDLAIIDEHALTDSAAKHGWACLLLHTLEDTTVPCPGALVSALDIIEQQLGRPLSIDSVARDCAVSRRKLHSLFRDHLGMAPYEYIRKRRAEHAIELLVRQPQMSIADIAVATGHQDQSGLTRALKSQFQITPAAYRRSIQQRRKLIPSVVAGCQFPILTDPEARPYFSANTICNI